MSKVELAVIELKKENPAQWAINYASHLDELPKSEMFEASLEFMWAFGVHFDYSIGKFLLEIPHVNYMYVLNHNICVKGIFASLKMLEDLEDEEAGIYKVS